MHVPSGVDVVVLQRDADRLADRLLRREVHDGVDVVLAEHGADQDGVPQIALVAADRSPGDLLDAVHAPGWLFEKSSTTTS
jgi:hypothetical protein